MNQVFYLAVNIVLALSATLALGRAGTPWRSLVKAYLLGGYLVIGLMVWEFAYRTMGVPYPVALETRERLLRQGVAVAWHAYDMAHSVCPEEVADIRDWIVGQLSAGR